MFILIKKMTESQLKYLLILIFALGIVVFLKQYITKNRLKKIKPHQTLIITFITVVGFFMGLVYVTNIGDAFYVALYPLYIAVVVATSMNIRNRALEINKVDKKYLIKEIRWGSLLALLLFFILVYINKRQIIAAGIILALNLLFLGFLANLGLIFYALKKKK